MSVWPPLPHESWCDLSRFVVVVCSSYEVEGVEATGGEDLCAVVYYAMAGDKSGSYFIETVSECAQ